MPSLYQTLAACPHAQRDAVLGLWQRHAEFAARAEHRLQQNYLNNPAGAGRCMLLSGTSDSGSDSELVGVLGLQERRLWRGELLARAATLADFVVAPAHRSLGPALQLMRAALAEVRTSHEVIYGLPNASSSAVTRRAGLPELARMWRMGKLLRSRYLLRRQGLAHLPVVSKAAAAALDQALRLADRWRSAAFTEVLRWTPAPLDEPDLQPLWQARPSQLWLAERSPAQLAWRFGPGTDGVPWQLSLARDRAGQPRAYVVWRAADELIVIADFFSRDPLNDLAIVLLSWSRHLRTSHHGDALSLEFAGHPLILRQLLRAGFVTKGPGSPLVGKVQGSVTAQVHRWDASQAFITSFDRDASA